MAKQKKISGRLRFMASFMALSILLDGILPTAIYALTSGASQPEVQSFEPIGTTDMVDLFSGDFTYNIPLFELPGPEGGYPFNLAYHAGIGMDQEASWVGLGWTLNPGAMTRQMRGLPDDFNGDIVKREVNMKQNITVGANLAPGLEIFGYDKESKEKIDQDKKFSTGFGGSIYYNNYNGFGYSLNRNFEVSKGKLNGSLSLGMDSREGATVGANLSLTSKEDDASKTLSLDAGYSSLSGLNELSLSYKGTAKKKEKVKRKSAQQKQGRGKIRVEGSLNTLGFGVSLINNDIPRTLGFDLPMRASRWNVSLKSGGAIFGLFINGEVDGFFSREKIDGADGSFATINTKAAGYLHLEDGGKESLRDMSREREGALTFTSPNLAIPSHSYDMFTATGQGMLGSIRPSRSDIGVLQDRFVKSVSNTYGLGGDLGANHLGINLTFGNSKTKAQAWESDNPMDNAYPFYGKSSEDPLYEPYAFRASGEAIVEPSNALDPVGGTDPIAVKLKRKTLGPLPNIGSGFDLKIAEAEPTFGDGGNIAYNTNQIHARRKERKKRSNVIQPLENKLLDGENGLSIFQISYMDSEGNERPIDRNSGMRSSHIGGFYCVNPSGLRYIYGLPAYNKKQVDCQYATSPQDVCQPIIPVPKDLTSGKYKVKGTDHYYSRQEMPEFTYAHLLTSVLGADYLDVDGIAGPSDGDLGYWVKFNYMQGASDYKWRAPFYGANYNPGALNRELDDKASYTYGEKEVYYVQKVETKSHIAIFETSRRDDGRGAGAELQNEGDALGAYQYKLDAIRLYTRIAYEQLGDKAIPIKEILFEYDNDLCHDVPNTEVSGGGKLTLRKLVFRYGGSRKGEMTPYQFKYASNPDYHTHKTDRWGNYMSYDHTNGDSLCRALQFPYVRQDNPNRLHADASAWSLSEIVQPSGAVIRVKYESDDYAYVQDRTAMQMLQIVGLGTEGNSRVPTDKNPAHTSVFFKLKEPIKIGEEWRFTKYFEGIENVKFNIKSRLTPYGKADFVSGYAKMNSFRLGQSKNGYYETGIVNLSNEEDRHPFAVAAWQHIRQRQPELLGTIDPEASTGAQIAGVVRGFVLAIPDAVSRMRDYYSFARSKSWGREISVSESHIRLNTPDGFKYGGGIRVRQLTLHDNWGDNTGHESGIYGQVYDYTMEEVSGGRTWKVSSGVASNEPYIGGDENALRRLKTRYKRKLRLQRDYSHVEEYPINESFYPGAQVGYRKVTIKSLATAVRAGEEVEGGNIPKNFPFASTGSSVYEFFTYKEFPVVTKETNIERETFRLSFPIAVLGSISLQDLTASQGYSVELNDMNGKPRKTSHYPQDKDGKILEEPTSYVEYFYKQSESGGKNIPDNQVPTLSYGKDGKPSVTSTGLLGHEHEFLMDMRENKTVGWSAGLNLNIDLISPVPPIITVSPVPSVSLNYAKTRTAVTNKVIYRAGVLERVEAFDGQSKVTTENLLWDANTGEVLLASVTNDYDRPIYSYSIPAYTQYDRMGHAYKNVGMCFKMQLAPVAKAHDVSRSWTNLYQPVSADSRWADHLVKGDEFIVGDGEGTAVYMGLQDGIHAFYTDMRKGRLIGREYEFFLYRSGRRNLLSAKAGSITSLEDPTKSGTVKLKNYNVKVPK